MSWRRKKPGHQQPWYWPSWTEITRSPHVKGWGRDKWPPFSMTTISNRFFNENVWIWIEISLKFVPINNIPALVQIMVWRQSSDKPLSELMMISLLTHMCVTRLQWVSVCGDETNEQACRIINNVWILRDEALVVTYRWSGRGRSSIGTFLEAVI